MYCIKCGAKLSSGQSICPICSTRVYHPDLPYEEKSTYPKKEFVSEEFNRHGLLFIITVLFLLTLLLPPILEFTISRGINWSGYTAGGVLLGYITFVLPLWFRSPNPVIFVPCDFAGAILYLLYIDLKTGGKWFLSFAFPVCGAFCLITTALIVLLRYIKRGRLYMFGGAFIALGAWTVLIEFLISITFHTKMFVWSPCTMITMFLIGMMLIVIAIVKPLKESLKKKFFIS